LVDWKATPPFARLHTFRGYLTGLTAEEIAQSQEIGAWSEDPQVQSGAEYVEKLRLASPRYSR